MIVGCTLEVKRSEGLRRMHNGRSGSVDLCRLEWRVTDAAQIPSLHTHEEQVGTRVGWYFFCKKEEGNLLSDLTVGKVHDSNWGSFRI